MTAAEAEARTVQPPTAAPEEAKSLAESGVAATTVVQPAGAPTVQLVEGLTREEFLAKHNGNKSSAIRALHAAGMKVGPISKFLDIKYQHARNVLIQPLGAKVPQPGQAVIQNAEAVAEVRAKEGV
jgi:hypothetical protein